MPSRADENLRILDLDLPGLYETQETPTRMIRGTFRDFTEWLEMAQAPAPEGSFMANSGEDSCESHSKGRDGWAGTSSYAQAVKLAKYGWPEGLDEVQKFIAKFESVIAGLLPIPEVAFDIHGDWLDMGRFLSGEPEHWGSLRDTEDNIETSHGKIVRIGLNMAASYGFDPTTLQRRGAACVALMHMLELTGRSCHLDIVEATTNSMRQESYITVKRAGETLSPEQIAFAAVNASMLRRFRFAENEKMPYEIAKAIGCEFGYGIPAQILRQDEYDVYLPALLGYGGKDFEGDDAAIEWVLSTLREQGIPITERGK